MLDISAALRFVAVRNGDRIRRRRWVLGLLLANLGIQSVVSFRLKAYWLFSGLVEVLEIWLEFVIALRVSIWQ